MGKKYEMLFYPGAGKNPLKGIIERMPYSGLYTGTIEKRTAEQNQQRSVIVGLFTSDSYDQLPDHSSLYSIGVVFSRFDELSNQLFYARSFLSLNGPHFNGIQVAEPKEQNVYGVPLENLLPEIPQLTEIWDTNGDLKEKYSDPNKYKSIEIKLSKTDNNV